MSDCHIVFHIVPATTAVIGPSKSVADCTTHGFHDFVPWAPPRADEDHWKSFCPVGQIERAVDIGLAKIAAAIDIIIYTGRRDK